MRIAVIEDQVLFQDFLVSLLKDKLGHEVVGIAKDGIEGLRMIREVKPDLLILDILIPSLSGIHIARTLQDELPSVKILVLSSETDRKTLHQLHKLHLPGFIDKKEASIKTLEAALAQISAGKRYFSPSMEDTLTDLKKDPMAFQKILTKREQEILTHIGAGLADHEIADLLGLSDSSVQTHRRNLFRKLDLHSTPELIRFAAENGFWKVSFSQMGLSESYHLHD
jgi:DNA-binding NarL/FixJ family response regulator